MACRMTLAVPNDGRLLEPPPVLLHDAGLVLKERRALLSRPKAGGACGILVLTIERLVA